MYSFLTDPGLGLISTELWGTIGRDRGLNRHRLNFTAHSAKIKVKCAVLFFSEFKQPSFKNVTGKTV